MSAFISQWLDAIGVILLESGSYLLVGFMIAGLLKVLLPAKLIYRHLKRRPGRTGMTVFGVASALFLFVSIESLAQRLESALSSGDAARTLVVYRQNRYCPMTSYLPERYSSLIRKIDGVESVLPVKVYLTVIVEFGLK